MFREETKKETMEDRRGDIWMDVVIEDRKFVGVREEEAIDWF